ncbi:discoidin domain-containing protein [Cellulophaga sp. F20128]|uniref:DUF4998 domain-containing protein n=1 Tax=Cellulophaga sp. F20128 TaxID=2926413 RepID=UPI001FF1F4E5|nr:DUF4998 domain-containing protein [Cellulophaga sp. F20128]MCK0158290.1 discoidin domain-containing protein [Cellulophaga sp. F20128]
MKKLKYIYGLAILLLIVMTSCNQDMNELHYEWLKDGEINYIGKIDSLSAFGGNKRIEFQCYLSDPRATSLRIIWNELGVDKQVTVPVQQHEAAEMFSFVIGENEEITEGEYTFAFISIDDLGTKSISFNSLGKVYGPKYQQTLNNRLVTSFELADGGIYLQLSSALNEDDKGIELMYNNGSENLVLTFTAEELKDRIFLDNPDFNTSITYATIYQPNNSIDVFKTETVTPPIEKLVNIALGKPVTSDSNLNDSFIPENAVDGIIGDNASRWINDRVVGNHWIEVDFEGTFDIEKVVVYDDSPISDFILQIEVGGIWQDLENISANNQKVFTGIYDGVSASKIRYTFETYDTDPSEIIRMFELEVFSTVKIQ